MDGLRSDAPDGNCPSALLRINQKHYQLIENQT